MSRRLIQTGAQPELETVTQWERSYTGARIYKRSVRGGYDIQEASPEADRISKRLVTREVGSPRG